MKNYDLFAIEKQNSFYKSQDSIISLSCWMDDSNLDIEQTVQFSLWVLTRFYTGKSI
jgi:hypothetical protein